MGGYSPGLYKKWFWNVYDYSGTLIVLNVLWVVCALPLITLPAATAGLFGASNRIAGYEEVRIRDFFADMRRGFLRSLRLCGLYAAALGVLSVNILFYARWMAEWPWTGAILSGAMIWIGVFVALTGLYSFPLVAGTTGPVRHVLKTSVLLTLDNPRTSVMMFLTGFGVLALSALTVAGLVFGGIGALSVLCSTGLREVRKRYATDRPVEESIDVEEARTWRDLLKPWEMR